MYHRYNYLPSIAGVKLFSILCDNTVVALLNSKNAGVIVTKGVLETDIRKNLHIQSHEMEK